MKSEPSGWEVSEGPPVSVKRSNGPHRPGAARSAGERTNPPRGRVKSAMLRHA